MTEADWRRDIEARLARLEAAEDRRTKDRLRQKRHRTDQASGRRGFRFKADDVELAEMLVAGGFLDPSATDDPAQVDAAVQAWADNAVATCHA